MASVSISGDVSGAISIAAPSAAGSGVLTLPTGTDTLVGKATTDTLTNKSIAATQLTGTIAAARLPAGSVLQVVNATYATVTSTTTNTFIDTGLTATITPTSNTSKILVLITHNGNITNNTVSNGLQFKIYRGATDLGTFENAAPFAASAVGQFVGGAVAMSYQDSPATTSATTYKTQFNSRENTATVFVQYASSKSTITLMEIAV